MTNDEHRARLERWIAVSRPNAKFVAVSHSDDFINPAAQLGAGFTYVNLYDEQVDANLVRRGDALVMIHNTYLSSFAYNLFLCWLYARPGGPIGGPTGGPDAADHHAAALDRLLAHNFKKFFAEQLWRAWSDVASRALLLETLLYEQACMVPVFAAQAADPALAKASNDAAALMSLALSMHELGHFTLDTRPGARDELLAETPDTAAPILLRIAGLYPEAFAQEVRCDFIAVTACLRGESAAADPLFALRVMVFAFAAYAVLFSLVRSAGAYAEARQAQPPESNPD